MRVRGVFYLSRHLGGGAEEEEVGEVEVLEPVRMPPNALDEERGVGAPQRGRLPEVRPKVEALGYVRRDAGLPRAHTRTPKEVGRTGTSENWAGVWCVRDKTGRLGQ